MAYQINLATLSGGRLFFLSHFFGTGNKTGVPGGRQFIAKSLWVYAATGSLPPGKGMRLPCPLCHANFVRRKCHGAAWLTVSGTPAERSRRAGDGAASSPNGVAAVSAAHDNTGSRRSFRRCRTVLSCIAANSCNSRTWHRPQSCRPRS